MWHLSKTYLNHLQNDSDKKPKVSFLLNCGYSIVYIVLFDAARKVSRNIEIIHKLINIVHEAGVADARVH